MRMALTLAKFFTVYGSQIYMPILAARKVVEYAVHKLLLYGDIANLSFVKEEEWVR